MAYLIDSDVLIWHLRGHEPTVQLLRALAQRSREEEAVSPLGCSVISVFEVRVGMHPEEKASTEKFLVHPTNAYFASWSPRILSLKKSMSRYP